MAAGKMRKEQDTLGVVEVPADKYWGAQTERSHENFRIGHDKMPLAVVHALALIKKAAAIVNTECKVLSAEKRDLICKACDEVLSGALDDQFPLLIWQTGSGTQTNMNVNEVISNRAIAFAGGVLGSKIPIHPNDDVNKSQSSNDAFPTAMHISAMLEIRKKLLPSLKLLHQGFLEKVKEFAGIIKTGRTHLMDATPLTLSQEFQGYARQLEMGIQAIENSLPHLAELAIGGTAVGTGLNTPCGYAKRMAEVISELTNISFVTAPCKFSVLAAHDALVEVSGALRQVACAYSKIAADIALMASGPRCGIGELLLPANEPGSSIMPGKVNPTQCEAMLMVSMQVYGNDLTVSMAGSRGQFELNVYKPVMIANVLHSITLLADMARNFYEKCLKDLLPNKEKIQEHLNHSLMLATALNPVIGYDKAAKAVLKAHRENKTLKEIVVSEGLLSPEEFDQIVDPSKMVGPSSKAP